MDLSRHADRRRQRLRDDRTPIARKPVVAREPTELELLLKKLPRGRIALLLVVAVLDFVLGNIAGPAWEQHVELEARRRVRTQRLLRMIANDVVALGAPSTEPGDARGMKTLGLEHDCAGHNRAGFCSFGDGCMKREPTDAWRSSIVYRCPGRLGPWELVAFGPNGRDDGGEGDDIVFVGSSSSSGRP